MGKQKFPVKSKLAGLLYWAMILSKVLTKEFVKDGDSQFQIILVNLV
jgi:hypothetical protein